MVKIMKVKVSKKEVRENYKNIICLGYCSLSWLLHYNEADYYSCGVYGWACDYYKINNNTIISTGYNPIGKITPDYKITKEYDEKARSIICDYSLTYEQQKNRIEKLLNEYIEIVLK